MAIEILNNSQVIIKRLVSSSFVRNVAMVGGGIAAAQAIAFAFMPFLTRLYGPSAFGIAAAFTAIVSIIMPIATMGYANAIVMPDNDEDASAVARLSILCGLIIAPVAFIAVYLTEPWLVIWTGMEKSPSMLYLIPLSLLINAFLSVANQSAIRAHLFKAKARAYVESTLVTNVSKLMGGIIAPSGLLLIILTLAGQVANFVMQMLRVPRSGVLKPSNWFGIKGVRNAAITQRDFALYRMPQSVIRAFSIGLPVIMLTTLFGAGSAGQYSLVLLVLSAPVMLLGDSVGEVFYPKITRAINEETGNAFSLIIKAVLVLFVVGVFPFGFIAIFGDFILPWIFGSEWKLAGQYSQWVAFWMIAMLSAGPAIAAIPALKIQSILLVYEVIITLARIGALYVGYSQGSDIFAIALFSLINVVGYIGLFLVVISKARNKDALTI